MASPLLSVLFREKESFLNIMQCIWKNCCGFPRNQPQWNLLQRNAILRKGYIKQLLRWRSQNLNEQNATGGVLPFQWVAAFNVFYIFPRKCKIKTGWSYKASHLLLDYVSDLISKIMIVYSQSVIWHWLSSSTGTCCLFFQALRQNLPFKVSL